jgi:hypothetical protein
MCPFALTALLVILLVLFVPLFLIYSHLEDLEEQQASLLNEYSITDSDALKSSVDTFQEFPGEFL